MKLAKTLSVDALLQISPVIIGGRGLKQDATDRNGRSPIISPVIIGGRGLKLFPGPALEVFDIISPVIIGGRGLKPDNEKIVAIAK